MTQEFYIPTVKPKPVRPFSEVHDELMETNPEYRAAWLAEHRKGDNLGYLHHEYMNDSVFNVAFECKNQYRKECLIKQLEEWRNVAGVSTAVISSRMGIDIKSVRRIEKNPLNVTTNNIARYATASGVKVSIEMI